MGMKIPVGGNQEKEKARADQTQAPSKKQEVDTTMVSHDSLTWQDLNNKGYAVFPLPAGQKYPPATGVTGNIPTLSIEETQKVCESAPQGSNWGIRATEIPDTEREVLILDVDQYEEKTGFDNFTARCADLGLNAEEVLGSAPRVTRRDPAVLSGHFYFTVPAGYQYANKVCKEVEVCQHKHRYAVAPGSVVDNETYRVFSGLTTQEIELPAAKELPELPEKLFNYLEGGKRSAPIALRGEVYGDDEAMEWLKSATVGFSEPMCPVVAAGVSEEALSEALDETDSHDFMTQRQEWLVRGAVFNGFTGVKAALAKLKAFFLEASDHRISARGAELEFNRALRGSVNKARASIERGKKTFLQTVAGASKIDMSTILGASEVQPEAEAQRAHLMQMIDSLTAGDLVAEVTAKLCPELIVCEGRVLDTSTDGLEEVTEERLNSIFKAHTRPFIRHISLLFDKKSDDEAEVRRAKTVGNALGQFELGRRANQLMQLKSALADNGREVHRSSFDKNSLVVPLKARRGLDLQLSLEHYKATGEVKLFDRPLERNEIFTKCWDFDLEDSRKAYEARRKQSKHRLVPGEELLNLLPFTKEDKQQLFDVYSLVLTRGDQKAAIPWLFGDGGTGKTGVIRMLTFAFNRGGWLSTEDLDPFGTVMSDQLSSKTSGSSHQHALFKVADDYAAVMSESESGTPISGSLLKQIAGGNGLSVKENGTKNTRPFRAMLLGETNEPPMMKAESGIRRRVFAAWWPASEDFKAEVRKFGDTHNGYNWIFDADQKYWVLLQLVKGWLRRTTGEVDIFDRSTDSPIFRDGTEQFWRESDPWWEFITQNFEFTGDFSNGVWSSEIEKRAQNEGLLESGQTLRGDAGRTVKQHMTSLGAEYKEKVPKKDGSGRKSGYRGVRVRTEGVVIDMKPRRSS